MNPNPNSEIDVKTLLALRQHDNAIQIITAKLHAKEMGPADHIRTKHEVKAFIESGDPKAAEALIQHSQSRVSLNGTTKEQITQRQTNHQKQVL